MKCIFFFLMMFFCYLGNLWSQENDTETLSFWLQVGVDNSFRYLNFPKNTSIYNYSSYYGVTPVDFYSKSQFGGAFSGGLEFSINSKCNLASGVQLQQFWQKRIGDQDSIRNYYDTTGNNFYYSSNSNLIVLSFPVSLEYRFRNFQFQTGIGIPVMLYYIFDGKSPAGFVKESHFSYFWDYPFPFISLNAGIGLFVKPDVKIVFSFDYYTRKELLDRRLFALSLCYYLK